MQLNTLTECHLLYTSSHHHRLSTRHFAIAKTISNREEKYEEVKFSESFRNRFRYFVTHVVGCCLWKEGTKIGFVMMLIFDIAKVRNTRPDIGYIQNLFRKRGHYPTLREKMRSECPRIWVYVISFYSHPLNYPHPSIIIIYQQYVCLCVWTHI